MIGRTNAQAASITIKNQDKTITANGQYNADAGYTGLGTITVNVEGSGGDVPIDIAKETQISLSAISAFGVDPIEFSFWSESGGTVYWGDGTSTAFGSSIIYVSEPTTVSHTYATAEQSFVIRIRADDLALDESFLQSNDSVREVRLGGHLISISAYAFGYCGNLETITIPDTIGHISSEAFANSGLRYVVMQSSTPPELDDYNAFDSSLSIVFLVPSGSEGNYESDTNWSYYAGQFVEY